MKKKIITKKRVMIEIITVILVTAAIIVSLLIYAQKQMEKIPSMSAMECLEYTLCDNKEAVISVGMIQKDGQMLRTVYGKNCERLPNELHRYEIGSLTKTITAAMIAEAEQKGLLNIDDTIDKYLDLPDSNTYPTIRDLLTHTSGYNEHYFESPMIGNFFAGRNDFCGITDDMVLDRLRKLDNKNSGKSWKYSNFGFAVLGLVLEKVYDREYTELANEFLQKHGMTNSHITTGEGDLGNYWEWNAEDAYMPAGAVVSDIQDMLIYAQHQLDNEGMFALTHETLKEVDATPENYKMFDMRVDAMGMGWIIDNEHGFIWHNGATGHYNSYLGFCPETKTAVVVLSNLSPNYRIPATVVGIKLLEKMQE